MFKNEAEKELLFKSILEETFNVKLDGPDITEKPEATYAPVVKQPEIIEHSSPAAEIMAHKEVKQPSLDIFNEQPSVQQEKKDGFSGPAQTPSLEDAVQQTAPIASFVPQIIPSAVSAPASVAPIKDMPYIQDDGFSGPAESSVSAADSKAPAQPKIKPVPSGPITNYTITQYMRNNGIVGEEANSSLITLGIANGMHLILEGSSGSGKTYLMNNVLNLFDKSQIYELGLSSSQAVWHQADEINACKILYIPELQKVMADKNSKCSSILEFIKSLTEGKDAKRMVTNGSKEGAEIYRIQNGRTLVTTIAKENNFSYDRETQRRFLVLETDDSKQHIEDIIQHKVSGKVNLDVSSNKASLGQSLSDRINYVMGMKDTYVLNPFIDYFKQAFPATNKTQAYMDHYLGMFDAWGKFFSPERESFEAEGKRFVLLNLEDVYNVYSMYQSHFVKTLESFSEEKDRKIEFKPDWTECLENGILSVNNDMTIILDSGVLHIGKDMTNVVEKWIKGQLCDTKVYATCYKTGNKIEIADISKLSGSKPQSGQQPPYEPPIRLNPEDISPENNLMS